MCNKDVSLFFRDEEIGLNDLFKVKSDVISLIYYFL